MASGLSSIWRFVVRTLAVLAVVAVIYAIINPTFAMIVGFYTLERLKGMPGSPPAFVGDATDNWPTADERVNAIVNRRFPVGSDAATMQKTLENEGFKRGTGGELYYKWMVLLEVCDKFLIVKWSTD